VRVRALAAGFGVAFGFLLGWTGFSDPSFIHRMLSLQTAYPYLVMATSIGLSLPVTILLRRRAPRTWSRCRPERRHVVGSVVFGLGWAIAATCPGPVAAQLGQGFAWSLCTVAGIVIGIRLYLWRQDAAARERVAAEAAPSAV
jgi:uncharacterized membrane protein YedE/YeeE